MTAELDLAELKAMLAEATPGQYGKDLQAWVDAACQRIEALEEAIEPFAVFADTFVDADGWNGPMRSTRIVDWFGPSDFRCARSALTPTKGR